MIVFFNLFSIIALVFFIALAMWENISFPGHSEICLPHKFVSSVGASAMFCLVWAKGLGHWGTTGEIIMLSWSQLDK